MVLFSLFWDQHIFEPNLLGTNFFETKPIGIKVFLDQYFWDKNTKDHFFWAKLCFRAQPLTRVQISRGTEEPGS